MKTSLSTYLGRCGDWVTDVKIAFRLPEDTGQYNAPYSEMLRQQHTWNHRLMDMAQTRQNRH